MSIRAYTEREKRADYRAGVVASVVVNSARTSKHHKAVQPKDFFPSLDPPRRTREQTPEQQRANLLAIAALSGGRVVRVPAEKLAEMSDG